MSHSNASPESACGLPPSRCRCDKSLSKALCFGLVLATASLGLTGCVTTQGGSAGAPSSNLLSFELREPREVRLLRRFVAESKLQQAAEHFDRNATFFEKRYGAAGSAIPPELTKLGEFVWEGRHRQKVYDAQVRLAPIQALPSPELWNDVAQAMGQANTAVSAVEEEGLLRLTKIGAGETEALRSQVARIAQLARANKMAAVHSITPSVLASGRHEQAFIGAEPLDHADFHASQAFQEAATEQIRGAPDFKVHHDEAIKLAAYLSPQTKALVDSAHAQRVRTQLMADGRISLDEVSQIASLRTPFGQHNESIENLVTIGYVDLTSASFKNRNLFDFEVEFKKDVPFNFVQASDAIFGGADLIRFDYVFVTDLAVAKVSRQFQNNRDLKSRVQSGTRSTQNPSYVSAMTDYQKAMVEFQRAQVNSAVPKPCVGLGCALQGLADGLASGAARRRVDETSSTLARTPQMLELPVYSEYTYKSVDIHSTKTADVDYYVIDIKGKKIYKNNFRVNDHEVFNVAFNVREEDPDRASITRNLKSEEEVANWEKRPISVSLTALFNPKNLSSSIATPYTNVQAFVKSLTDRSYASAAPTYSGSARTATAGAPAVIDATSPTIADARFDSVVVVRNAKSMGAGFYVTPELVLTAYHVVDGSSLVEMTFYDGTKTYGRVVDHDVRLDLALVKAQTAGKPLRIHSGPLKLGETVEAIGHPKGYAFTITRGVISAVRRQRSAAIGSDNLVEFVQTDTPISPGNSGGPLLLKDAVIGVNDWIRIDKASQNLNFSVSFNEVRLYLDRFRAK